MAGFPQIQVKSSDPFERGRQLGAASTDELHGSMRVYADIFNFYTGLDWAAVRAHAAKFRDPIAAYDEQIMVEMDGMAAGAGVDPDDVLAINCRTEIMFGVSATVPSTPECTSFFAGRSATADGHVIMGQNWDWRNVCGPNVVLAEIEQGEDRPSFVMLAEGGLVGKLGFNSAGVGVAANALVSSIDLGEPAVPFHVVLRGILNSSSLEEALSAVVRSKRAASANYLIGSASGQGIDVETGPGGVENVRIINATNDTLAHANHFTCGVSFADTGIDRWPCSPLRTEAMGNFLKSHHGEIDRENLVTGLSDHQGLPTAICRHNKSDVDHLELGKTLASWIIDLDDLVADIAPGNPCETAYTRFVPKFSKAAVPVG